jgi:predicted Zn-dependent protease
MIQSRTPARHLLLILLSALVGCAATPSKANESSADALAGTESNRETLIDAMGTELERSMDRLKLEDYETPYFIAYQMKDSRQVSLSGKFGALVSNQADRNRRLYVEVRVGDYGFDNYANVDAENFRFGGYNPSNMAPIEPDTTAMRSTLWLLTDDAYKSALSNFLAKKGGSVFQAEDDTEVASFSKAEPNTYRGDMVPLQLDRERWKGAIRRITKGMLEYDHLMDAEMNVTARRVVRYHVNSEGNNIIDNHLLYSVRLQAWTRAEDGMLLDNTASFYARTPGELPSETRLQKAASSLIEELGALREASVIDPYTGPAILMPEASGVLFHEAVGHRLEGERQRDDSSGQTFKNQLGEEIIPNFLSVYDDPTLETLAGQQLNGHYEFDDEGVKAQRATLVEDGVLKGFLKSRTPVENSPESNGHGRAQGTSKPIGRMANTIVKANDAKTMSMEKLKEKLIEEVKAQDKPFGLIIQDITGGSTNTSNWGYQAFKGSPHLIYKVDPETGEETLVRGAELVGTPLTSINKIVAAGPQRDVFNGYCGAESGYVPVSAVAPALLTTELELQRTQQSKERPPILKAPWKPTPPEKGAK